ncbi:9274_t:CDS:2, partial [Dentiscutata heterogama]
MTPQLKLIKIADSLTDYEVENLIKILQSHMNKKSHIPLLSLSPLYIAPSSSFNNNIIVDDIKMNGNFLKFTWRKQFPCPLCKKSVQFSSKKRGSSWKKCSFIANKYDKQAINEYLKTCKGKISRDFILITLKIYPLDEEEGTTDTKFNKIKLNERCCSLCKDIHSMYDAYYGEELGCWSSNTTLKEKVPVYNKDEIDEYLLIHGRDLHSTIPILNPQIKVTFSEKILNTNLMPYLPDYEYTMILSGKDKGKEKPPFVVRFENKHQKLYGGKMVISDSITLIGCHTKPDNSYNETMKLLEQVYPKVLEESGKNPLTCGIGNEQDTTVIPSGEKSKFKSYDRIIYQESNEYKFKNCKVYRYDKDWEGDKELIQK